jgi:(2S)-methylsuccinyl-CoA dehydrogenase
MPVTDLHATARPQAAALLAQVRTHFQAAVRRAASLCAVDGKLDATRLDHRQWICHELALACADLLAAESALAGTEGSSQLDRSLALAFATEAIGSVLGRLDGVALDSGADPRPVQQLMHQADVTALRRTAASADAWAALGRAVAATDDEIGAVQLDEPVALAQAAFRRFAAEVVAPMAEAIHRQDLTVPESLLQPMRELGVSSRPSGALPP